MPVVLRRQPPVLQVGACHARDIGHVVMSGYVSYSHITVLRVLFLRLQRVLGIFTGGTVSVHVDLLPSLTITAVRGLCELPAFPAGEASGLVCTSRFSALPNP